MPMDNSLSVSIIIPHYNKAKRLQEVLYSISSQTWRGAFEVIVVDNNSSENLDFLEDFDFVRLVHEKKYLSSPYSARNRGIEQARGELLAFIDATCVPNSHWLEEGIKAFKAGADIIAGNIKFSFSEDPSIGELYDAVFHVNAEASAKRGFVLGGNFFIRAVLFKKLGLYAEGQRTSGDFLLSSQLIKSGYKMVFCPSALVYYPARGGKFVFKKTWRISQGQPLIWKRQGRFLLQLFKSFGKILPPNPYKIKQIVASRGYSEFESGKWLKIYFLRYLMLVVSLIGNLTAIVKGVPHK
jgi:glycosyltransferase involved in cell wall biosynthesis